MHGFSTNLTERVCHNPNGFSDTLLSLKSLNKPQRLYCLLALVPVLSQSFFTLVRSHLVAFLFLSAWHSFKFLNVICKIVDYFIFAIKLLAGLNAG